MLFIFRWLLNAGALLLIARFVPGVELTGLYASVITIAILGIVNAIIRPLLILLTLPITLLTLGLFTFVINAILFWFVSTIVQGFVVEGFLAAFFGALFLTLISWVVNLLFKPRV